MPSLSLTIPACAGCCCPCRLTPTVNVTLSGVTFCPGPVFIGIDGLGQSITVQITAWDDPNVLTPVPYGGGDGCLTGSGSVSMGSFDYDLFADGVYSSSDTQPFRLDLDCSDGSDGLRAVLRLNVPSLTGTNFSGTAFLSTNMQLDTSAPNELVACGDAYDLGFVFGTTGTAFVETT